MVIGAGTGGLVSAAGAAGLGGRVALVERELMGGDCLNTGCVPSKALIRCAKAAHEASGRKGCCAVQLYDVLRFSVLCCAVLCAAMLCSSRYQLHDTFYYL